MSRQWYAVEADLAEILDEDACEQLLDELLDARLHPALSWSPTGRVRVTVSVQASSLARAAARALELLEQRRRVHSVRVMLQQERDDDLEDELLSVSQAAQLLGISRASVIKRIDAGSMPAHKVGATYVIPAATVRSHS